MSSKSAKGRGQTTKTVARRARGRPRQLFDGTIVVLCAHEATTKLQKASDRRAVIDTLVELGGKAMKTELDESFRFDTRKILLSLRASGWVEFT